MCILIHNLLGDEIMKSGNKMTSHRVQQIFASARCINLGLLLVSWQRFVMRPSSSF